MESRTIKKITHNIYNDIEEFKRDHPDVGIIDDWRVGAEGDWVKTDDGRVCQVLKRKHMNTKSKLVKKGEYIRTIVGSFVCSSKYKMEGKMRLNMYSFGVSDKSWWDIQHDRVNPTKKEFLFAKYIAKGEDIATAFMHAFPTNQKDYAERQGSTLIKQERIISLIREEIDKIMHKAEITPLYLLNKMKDIVEDTSAKDSDKVSVLKELVTIAGMKDTEKRSESVTVFQGFSQDQLTAIGGGKTKKLAEGYREKEV
jgi:hypothetical protein